MAIEGSSFHPPSKNNTIIERFHLKSTGQFEPHALVIEPSTGHLIYSAVSTKSYIGILNIETKERKTVVPGLTSVYNIAIHPKKGYNHRT